MTEQSKKDTLQDLAIVLDFVERWNKQDKDRAVAFAHHRLETIFENKYESTN